MTGVWLRVRAGTHRRGCGTLARSVLDRLGYEGVTYHTLRRTVATLLDQAGLSGREIADQLGHAQPSMTLDRYMGRRVVSARSAEVLDR